MALQHPHRQGFLLSATSLSVLEGSELFKGLISAKVTGKIDGRKRVRAMGRKALGTTAGQLVVEVELVFEATSFFEYQADHPAMLDEIHNLTFSYEEGPLNRKVKVTDFCFDSVEIPSEGTEEIKVTLPGEAIDCLIADNGGEFKSLVNGDSLGNSNDAGAA